MHRVREMRSLTNPFSSKHSVPAGQRALRSAVTSILAIVVAVLGLQVAAGAVTGIVVVAANGSFDSLAAGTTVAGVVSPSGAQQFNYSFSATCDGATCPSSGSSYVWNFGDGSSVTSTSSAAATHAYATTGVFTATFTDSSSTGYGTGTVTVLVSPRFSDADASTNTAGDAAPADRAAIWTVAAYQIMASCGQVSGTVGSASQNRPAFCARPSAGSGASAIIAKSSNTNGGTTASCFNAVSGVVIPPYENCGLSPAAFLLADSSVGAAAGNPLNRCGAVCQAALASDNELNSAGNLVVGPTNCGDGWTSQQEGSFYTAVSGVESGCVSRGQFFQALVNALDNGPSVSGLGVTFTASQLSSASAACPGDSSSLINSPYAQDVERANFLGLTTTWMGTTNCNLSAPITKGEAYQILAAATGTPAASTCAGYRDLTDETLGNGTLTPDPQCLSDLALVATGVPVVDSSTCATGGGTCFNAYDPLSRGGLATLLASLVNGLPNPTNIAYSPTSWTQSVDNTSIYNGNVIQSGPSSYYELNDSVGGAFDASGGGAYGLYDGTYTQSAGGPLAGATKGSVTLSGAGYVSVPSPFSSSAGATTSLWFNTTGNGPLLAGQNGPVGGGAPGGVTNYLSIVGGLLVTGMANTSTGLGDNGPASSEVVNDGTWHQVVYVTSATGGLSLYLDGNLIAKSSASDTWPATTYAQVGAGRVSGAWSYFTGSIADVATWSSALSGASVSSLYASSNATNPWGVYATTTNASSPVGFWKLDGSNSAGCTQSSGPSGTSCDASGHANSLSWTSGSNTSCGTIAGTNNVTQTSSGPTNATYAQEIKNGSAGCVGTSANTLAATSALSLQAWVKLESAPATSGAIAHVIETGGTDSATLTIDSSCKSYSANGVSFEIEGTGWLACVTAAALPVTNKWYEITGTWSGTSGTAVGVGQMQLYVNGVALTTTSVVIGTGDSAPLTLGSVIVGGSTTNSASNLFTQSSDRGALADVAVFASALSPTLVSTSYCAAKVNSALTSC